MKEKTHIAIKFLFSIFPVPYFFNQVIKQVTLTFPQIPFFIYEYTCLERPNPE